MSSKPTAILRRIPTMSKIDEKQAIQLSSTVVLSPIEVKSKFDELMEKQNAEPVVDKPKRPSGLHQRVWQSVSRETAKELMSILEPFASSSDFEMKQDARKAENYLIEKFSL
jgi:hypothetical protein